MARGAVPCGIIPYVQPWLENPIGRRVCCSPFCAPSKSRRIRVPLCSLGVSSPIFFTKPPFFQSAIVVDYVSSCMNIFPFHCRNCNLVIPVPPRPGSYPAPTTFPPLRSSPRLLRMSFSEFRASFSSFSRILPPFPPPPPTPTHPTLQTGSTRNTSDAL